MKLSVLVPTHQRPDALARCLDALARQTRPPDEVVVVARVDDTPTHEQLAAFPAGRLPLVPVRIEGPGVVAALNAGLARVTGDIIAITDDDTAPWPDWLERIARHFADSPRLGGLGGRDVIRANGDADASPRARVGRVSWFGRWVGQAHRGTGPAREVELLKGCNMSYRRAAIDGLGFDTRLRGGGAQWFNDSAFSLAVKRAGWQIVYDPSVRVDHYLGPRPQGDDRLATSPSDVFDIVYNETLVLLEHLSPFGRLAFLGFGLGIGTRRAPGLLQWMRSAARGGGVRPAFQVAAWRARFDAWRDHRRQDRPRAVRRPGDAKEQSEVVAL